MMRIIIQVFLYVQMMGAVSSETLADYDLPGIFSSTFCKDEILRSKFEPICKCKDTHDVTDVVSICSKHAEFGHCVEHHLNQDKWGFLRHTFSKKKFIFALNYICETYDNAADIMKCIKPKNANMCTTMVAEKLKITESINEVRACNVTDTISRCTINVLKGSNCSPNVQYFWSKLSESYMASKCTKYLSTSRASKCSKMEQLFHPNKRDYTYQQCLDVVDMKKTCFLLERQNSVHHADIWYNKDFKIDRQIKYERFRCRVQEERKKDIYCETSRRKNENSQCLNNHDNVFNQHVDLIKNGSDVSVAEICKLYYTTMECVQKAFEDCPKANSEHPLANYCGQMPVSCHCPIALESNGSIRIFSTITMLILILCMSI